MTTRSRVFLILILTLTLTTVANAAELNGVVKSETGTPLSGVQILTYAPHAGTIDLGSMKLPASSKRYEVTTDANGKFKIPSHGQVIYFYRHDLKPLTKIVDLTIAQLDVVMEDGAKSLWKVPACSASDKAGRTGVGFMMIVPKDVLVKKDNGEKFEEGGYFFRYQNSDNLGLLINSWESTSLQPSEEELLKAKQFSQRRWASGEKWGYDFRWTMPDGHLWRRVSTRNGALAYRATTSDAAKILDGMIDTMCFDEPAVK